MKKAKHTALPCPAPQGKLNKHLDFPREGESPLWPILGCCQARALQGGDREAKHLARHLGPSEGQNPPPFPTTQATLLT